MKAVWFKSGHHNCGLTGKLPVVVSLSFFRRDVPGGFEQAVVVKPGHPFQSRKLHRLLCFLRPLAMNKLGLVRAVEGLSQGVVVVVAFAADRGLDTGLSQTPEVPDADVLRASSSRKARVSVYEAREAALHIFDTPTGEPAIPCRAARTLKTRDAGR